MAFDKDEIKQLRLLLQEQREDIVDTILDHIDKNVPSKEEIKEIKAAMKHLPNKEEFYKVMNRIADEYKKFNEEAPIFSTT